MWRCLILGLTKIHFTQYEIWVGNYLIGNDRVWIRWPGCKIENVNDKTQRSDITQNAMLMVIMWYPILLMSNYKLDFFNYCKWLFRIWYRPLFTQGSFQKKERRNIWKIPYLRGGVSKGSFSICYNDTFKMH